MLGKARSVWSGNWVPPRAGLAVDRLRHRIAGSARVEREALAGGVLAGICPVCGASVRFGAFGSNPREAGRCSACGASNRQRQMAYVLRRVLRLDLRQSLSPPAHWIVLNTESRGPVHAALGGQPGYIASEYWGAEHPGGSLVNGVRHEDLQALSLADGSVDLVLSSDVLEHVPDPYAAHREIARVLRPGGWHIFTVPFRETEPDDVRAVPRAGRPVLLAPALYHEDPLRPEGTLVWRIFGYEMLGRLRGMGFAVRVHRLFVPGCGIIGSGAVVFAARKRL